MHEIHLLLTDRLYDRVQRRAAEAGFSKLAEYIEDLVVDNAALETEDLDHRFSPQVVGNFDQIQEEILAGAKSFSERKLDEYLHEKSQLWRDSHTN